MPSRLAKFALSLLLLAAAAPAVQAQDFPNRPIRMVIAFPAGGPTDFVGRLVADKVKDILGQTSSSRTSPAPTARSAPTTWRRRSPTAHTLFLTTVGAVAITPAHAQRPALRHAARLRAGDAGGAQHHGPGGARRQPGQDRSKEFVAMAKAKNGGMPFASTGVGSTTHLALELFASVGGLQIRARALSRRGAGADRSARRPGRRRSPPTRRC